MSHRVSIQWFFFPVAVLAAACSRPDASRNDASADSARADVSPVSTDAGWANEIGRLLVVPADSDDAGVILFPQNPTAALVGALPVTVLSSSGESQVVRAALVESDSAVCGEAPTMRFVTAAPREWAVALAGTSLIAVSTDSVEGLAPADSARMVTTISRLASSVTPAGSRFTALPFVVLSARTFERHARHFVLAHLRRRLPQEATPHEEHVFLVAERAANGTGPYTVVFSERSEGTEETVDHYDALGVLAGGDNLFVILSRDRDERSSYEVIERTRTAAWRTRWSRSLSC